MPYYTTPQQILVGFNIPYDTLVGGAGATAGSDNLPLDTLQLTGQYQITAGSQLCIDYKSNIIAENVIVDHITGTGPWVAVLTAPLTYNHAASCPVREMTALNLTLPAGCAKFDALTGEAVGGWAYNATVTGTASARTGTSYNMFARLPHRNVSAITAASWLDDCGNTTIANAPGSIVIEPHTYGPYRVAVLNANESTPAPGTKAWLTATYSSGYQYITQEAPDIEYAARVITVRMWCAALGIASYGPGTGTTSTDLRDLPADAAATINMRCRSSARW